MSTNELNTKTLLTEHITQLRNQRTELINQWRQVRNDMPSSVEKEHVISVVSLMSGLPLNEIEEEERTKLNNLEKNLEKKVKGQDEAIVAISQSIRRSRAGLKDPKRPIGSFLLLGPTGVGKTHLAKVLAEEIFGDEDALIRIDMSEYAEKHAVSRFVGAPPGYVGFEEGGQLTELVRRKPFSVILLDELEKAHFDVYNILLQILDEGRLTDGQGRTIDFKHTLIVMTSNIGTDSLDRGVLGFSSNNNKDGHDLMRERLQQSLKSYFRPEFLNRIDEVIVFKNLSKGNISDIAKGLIDQVKVRLEDKDIKLTVTKKVIDKISELAYNSMLGARPLKRLIQEKIESKLADSIVNGTLSNNSNVKITLKNNEFEYEIISDRASEEIKEGN